MTDRKGGALCQSDLSVSTLRARGAVSSVIEELSRRAGLADDAQGDVLGCSTACAAIETTPVDVVDSGSEDKVAIAGDLATVAEHVNN